MTRNGSDRQAVAAEALAADFGPRSTTARRSVTALYQALGEADPPETQAAVDWWRASDAGGSVARRPSRELEMVARRLGLPDEHLDPDLLRFAMETYYALLVKLLVAEATARRRATVGPAETLRRAETDAKLRDETRRFESSLPFAPPEEDDLYAWYAAARSPAITEAIRDVAGRVARFAAVPMGRPGTDCFGHLYERLFPKGLRHGLGEYYTPDWLAEHVLDETGYTGSPAGRLLDPTCGSGVFLMAAIRRIRAARGDNARGYELARQILDGVVGFDRNRLAVMTARANYLLAIGDLLDSDATVEIPVYRRDAILDEPRSGERFDRVVGNPPWIAWDYLPADYRTATAPLWQHYGLFSLSGTEARHGGGKKDLSMLVLYVAADRYLEHGGRLGFVITQTLLQTKGAGDGFRRFRLGTSGEPLAVLHVDDMVRLRPFAGAANWTAVIVLEKGRETVYPVPYTRWRPDGGRSREPCTARPIDPARARSPWLVLPEKIDDATPCPGPSDYVAHLGANTGGANGVYWLEVLRRRADGVLVRNLPGRGKRAVEPVECVLDPDLLYPLLRWGDVARYRARPGAWLLLAQDVDARTGIDETVMRERYPRTLAYLTRFRDALTARAAYRRYQHRAPFYSMYNVGPYTPAPIKVVWRRMDTRINAAVVQSVDDPVLGTRPVIAQETCVELEAGSLAEAHYAAAVLSSRAVNALVASYSVRGGKGFGTPSMLDYVNLRRFEPEDPLHAALAEASATAHRLAAAGEDVAACQQRIDRLAEDLFVAKCQ